MPNPYDRSTAPISTTSATSRNESCSYARCSDYVYDTSPLRCLQQIQPTSWTGSTTQVTSDGEIFPVPGSRLVPELKLRCPVGTDDLGFHRIWHRALLPRTDSTLRPVSTVTYFPLPVSRALARHSRLDLLLSFLLASYSLFHQEICAMADTWYTGNLVDRSSNRRSQKRVCSDAYGVFTGHRP